MFKQNQYYYFLILSSLILNIPNNFCPNADTIIIPLPQEDNLFIWTNNFFISTATKDLSFLSKDDFYKKTIESLFIVYKTIIQQSFIDTFIKKEQHKAYKKLKYIFSMLIDQMTPLLLLISMDDELSLSQPASPTPSRKSSSSSQLTKFSSFSKLYNNVKTKIQTRFSPTKNISPTPSLSREKALFIADAYIKSLTDEFGKLGLKADSPIYIILEINDKSKFKDIEDNQFPSSMLQTIDLFLEELISNDPEKITAAKANLIDLFTKADKEKQHEEKGFSDCIKLLEKIDPSDSKPTNQNIQDAHTKIGTLTRQIGFNIRENITFSQYKAFILGGREELADCIIEWINAARTYDPSITMAFINDALDKLRELKSEFDQMEKTSLKQ